MSERFVLVHGAWHGGWAWRRVRTALEAAGQEVSAPTTAGLGLDDDPTGVSLEDCVQSIVDHVERHDLQDITRSGTAGVGS